MLTDTYDRYYLQGILKHAVDAAYSLGCILFYNDPFFYYPSLKRTKLFASIVICETWRFKIDQLCRPLAAFWRTAPPNNFTLDAALPWVLGNTPAGAVQRSARSVACSERGRFFAASNSTLNFFGWVLGTKAVKWEVDRMSRKSNCRHTHIHTYIHPHIQTETASILARCCVYTRQRSHSTSHSSLHYAHH